jgi:dTDP-4-amino-4,6-dideoxygalactose transaminase
LNIGPVKVRQAVRQADPEYRIKAILPVHLYGHACDIESLVEIASENNLAIIEDAAHALPSRFKGRTIGSWASTAPVPFLTCFSFYATKNITTGEGGMLTGLAPLIDEARVWSLHGITQDVWEREGIEKPWFYEVDRPGFKYNMTDLQAAIGMHQLPKLQELQARRTEIAARYNEAFGRFECFQIPASLKEVEHAWHLYVLRLHLDRLTIPRNQFIRELAERNISASVHFIPVHLHAYYRDKYGYQPESFPVAHNEYQRMLSLPLYPKMSDDDVADVIEAVTDVAEKYAASPHSVCA